MHELSLIRSILNILEKEIQSPEVGDVKTVYLEVGKLRYVVPEIMISCFEHVQKNGKLKNAVLDIEELPVRIKCNTCGVEKEISGDDYSCGECSGGDIEMISGKEFVVKGIEW